MVGGLVQDQKVDLLVHEHTQPQAGLLAAGQGGHGLEHVLPLELKGGQPVPGALGGAVQVVQHGVQQAALRVVEADVLWQVTHLYSWSQTKLSAVRLLLPQNDPHQSGLARAVVADQADALAPLYL